MIKLMEYYKVPLTKTTIYEGLLGQVMMDINVSSDKAEVTFEMSNGRTYKVFHEHELCEKVYIESMSGVLYGGFDNLLGTPLLLAESESGVYSTTEPDHKEKTGTTFTFTTIKGSVTICWVGIDCGTGNEVVGLFQDGVNLRA